MLRRAGSWPWGFWLLLAASVAPALAGFRVQKKNWINIPIWDEWDTPGVALLHYAQGTLTWTHLFAQHNESRKLIPRLIHIGIAAFAGWDVRQGMALTFFMFCLASIFALIQLRQRTTVPISRALMAWLLINLFLFAPSQYENFLSGFVFEILIPCICLFACAGINLSSRSLVLKTACNSLLALIATYTFAHGMLVWALAIPLPSEDERLRKTARFYSCYAIYIAAALIAICAYFTGYERPDIFPPSAGLNHLPQLLEFLTVWLGAVVRSPLVNARFSGATAGLIMIVTVVGSVSVLRKAKERFRFYYPWLLQLGFALASGVLIAIGRVEIGVDNVFNTWFNGFSGIHYNATSVFVYVALVGLLFNLYEDRIRLQPLLRNRFLTGSTISCTLLAVAWVEMSADESIRVKEFQANRRRARTAVIWSNALPNNPELWLAYPYPKGLPQRVEEMRAAGILKLPVVSESLRQIIAADPIGGVAETGRIEEANTAPTGKFRFAGWARNPMTQRAADYVVLGWQASGQPFHPLTAIATGRVSSAADVYGPESRKAGFELDVDLSQLPAESVIIKGWAIDWERQQAFPMQGHVKVDGPRS